MSRKVRKELHTRMQFAAKRYFELVFGFKPDDHVGGRKAKKIDKAYRIYCHYSREYVKTLNEINGIFLN